MSAAWQKNDPIFLEVINIHSITFHLIQDAVRTIQPGYFASTFSKKLKKLCREESFSPFTVSLWKRKNIPGTTHRL